MYETCFLTFIYCSNVIIRILTNATGNTASLGIGIWRIISKKSNEKR